MKIRFSFSSKIVFSITRQKVFKKRSKNKSFNSKKWFENLNQSFRFEIKKHGILFNLINEIIQKNKTFVNVSFFILIVVKILQKTDYFAQ